MIDGFYLAEWRMSIPWIEDYQIEQDLIIHRALVNLYENEKIRESLVFKGGTALNKIFFQPPVRYSEDIDLVQIIPQPIGPIINEIRKALSWLGQPKGKLTARSAKLIYAYKAIDGFQRKLKIEINTTEHFNVHDLINHEFKLESTWFAGQSQIRTYQLNELMGTKLKALYQRRKGRDLFDVWYVLKNNLVDCKSVLHAFKEYCDNEGISISRAEFEKNLYEKKRDENFQNDILNLIIDHKIWSPTEAFEITNEQLIKLLPGKPWKGLQN